MPENLRKEEEMNMINYDILTNLGYIGTFLTLLGLVLVARIATVHFI